jgi:hypothetical protein
MGVTVTDWFHITLFKFYTKTIPIP